MRHSSGARSAQPQCCDTEFPPAISHSLACTPQSHRAQGASAHTYPHFLSLIQRSSRLCVPKPHKPLGCSLRVPRAEQLRQGPGGARKDRKRNMTGRKREINKSPQNPGRSVEAFSASFLLNTPLRCGPPFSSASAGARPCPPHRGEETAAGGRRRFPQPRQAQPRPRRPLHPEGGRTNRPEGLRPGGQEPQVRATAPARKGVGGERCCPLSLAGERGAACQPRPPLGRSGKAGSTVWPCGNRVPLTSLGSEGQRPTACRNRGLPTAPSALRGLRPPRVVSAARRAAEPGGETPLRPGATGRGTPRRRSLDRPLPWSCCLPGTRFQGNGGSALAARQQRHGRVRVIGS